MGQTKFKMVNSRGDKPTVVGTYWEHSPLIFGKYFTLNRLEYDK